MNKLNIRKNKNKQLSNVNLDVPEILDKKSVEDLKEDIKLIEIKEIADNIYKENIKNNIINYIKKNNNDNELS